MEDTVEFLNDIYKNVRIGEESTGTLLKRVENTELKNEMITQMQGYNSLGEKVRQKIEQAGGTAQQIGTMKKMMINGGVKANSMANHSSVHIAEMLIQGSTMGIIETTECINRHPSADGDVQRLANEVLKFEQNNIERMKEYL